MEQNVHHIARVEQPVKFYNFHITPQAGIKPLTHRPLGDTYPNCSTQSEQQLLVTCLMLTKLEWVAFKVVRCSDLLLLCGNENKNLPSLGCSIHECTCTYKCHTCTQRRGSLCGGWREGFIFSEIQYFCRHFHMQQLLPGPFLCCLYTLCCALLNQLVFLCGDHACQEAH